MAGEANLVRDGDHTLNKRLGCIYDDEPLAFKNTQEAQDYLEEIDLGGWIDQKAYIYKRQDRYKFNELGDSTV